MTAAREELAVMRCVRCGTVKAWRDGFPNVIEAICWDCAWAAHVRDAHPWQTRRARNRARRKAKRVAIWEAQRHAISDLQEDLISGGKS